jgi:hypothetical protein
MGRLIEDWRVEGLPRGDHAVVAIARPNGSRRVFYKLSDGRVFIDTMRSGVSLLAEYGMNDSERRAWCRLSGVKFADLAKRRKAYRTQNAAKELARVIDRLRRNASYYGYKLVKVTK